jgi:hypothetical protein
MATKKVGQIPRPRREAKAFLRWKETFSGLQGLFSRSLAISF